MWIKAPSISFSYRIGRGLETAEATQDLCRKKEENRKEGKSRRKVG